MCTQFSQMVKTKDLNQYPGTNEPTQFQERPLFDCYGSIGILKSSWVSKAGKVRATNFGTGFIISPRLIMTCSHNIFAQGLSREADCVEFLLNFENRSERVYYKSQRKLIIKRQLFSNDKSLKLYPQAEELCLILLEHPIQTQSQTKILGGLELYNNNNSAGQTFPLKIIGYPKSSLSFGASIDQLKAKRQQRDGVLVSVDNDVIRYTNSTEVGHSGSPIFALHPKGNYYYIVGIHTHKGFKDSQNCGLYFNKNILKRIKSYVDTLNTQYGLNQSPLILLQEYRTQEKLSQTVGKTVGREINDEEEWQNNSNMDSEYDQIIYSELTWQQIHCNPYQQGETA